MKLEEALKKAEETRARMADARYKVRLTFIEPLLGSAPNTEEIYKEYVASKAPDAMTTEQEVEAYGADSVEERGTTIFTKDKDGNPMIWDYQVRGYFKGTCGALQRSKGRTEKFLSSSIKAYMKNIYGCIYVFPRTILINPPEEGGDRTEITINQRPLRATTAQGDRVALASSEELPAGSWCDIEISLHDKTLWPTVMEWLDNGVFSGLGQWRNGSYGRFVYEILDE